MMMCEHDRNQNEPEPCTCLANAERRFIFHPSKHQSKHHITSTTSLQQNKMTILLPGWAKCPMSDGTATAKFIGVKNWPLEEHTVANSNDGVVVLLSNDGTA